MIRPGKGFNSLKIVFWSPIHGQSGTTSNTLVTAFVAGMDYKKKILLTHTHFKYNNLEAPLVGSNSDNIASKDYFCDVGIDMLSRYFKAAQIDYETLENCCISLTNTNVLLLPGTTKTNKESFDYEMDTIYRNLFRKLETLYGIVFIDVCSGENWLSQKLMEEADLIIINLCQNHSVIDLYLRCFNDKNHEKLFYLFGNYDSNSKYNISNLRRKYHNVFHSKNSGVIPYNTAFLDAQSDGKAVEFIRKCLNVGKGDENYYFIMEVRRTTQKILQLAGIHIEMKERT